ncbi:hypothetical protein WA026_023388 [Henosepilachna vigintioctopunctata]|uniref:EB domain-containing protein n=1 Tax=Henosepilachna vigintioctopunctata TaxID=420089 RepID=A0AAW1V275_9CUCU
MFHLDIRIIYIISTSLNVLCTETYDDLRNGSDDDLFPCLENSDCERVNGTCENLFCKCNNSYNCKAAIPILVNKLGESCETIKECNIEYSVCDENKKCSCINEYIHSSNERKCLKTASGLGGDCEESAQCYNKTPLTVCQENKCVCQQHMHEYNRSCYKNVGKYSGWLPFGLDLQVVTFY